MCSQEEDQGSLNHGPIVSTREVNERSDEFGRTTAVVRSPAEILPSGHSILQGAPPVMLESAGIVRLILTTVDQTPFLQMDWKAGKTQLCENSTDLRCFRRLRTFRVQSANRRPTYVSSNFM